MRKLPYLFLFMVAACAAGGQAGSPQNFSVLIPEGWRKINTARYFIMTKGDAFSQYILVQQRHIDKPFSHTDRKLKKDMLPEKAAEVILNELTSDSHVHNLEVMARVPAKVNQYQGFKLIFTHNDENGAKYKTLYYGLLQGNWFYSLRYSAGATKYSSEDIEIFQRVLNSFEIKEGGSVTYERDSQVGQVGASTNRLWVQNGHEPVAHPPEYSESTVTKSLRLTGCPLSL